METLLSYRFFDHEDNSIYVEIPYHIAAEYAVSVDPSSQVRLFLAGFFKIHPNSVSIDAYSGTFLVSRHPKKTIKLDYFRRGIEQRFNRKEFHEFIRLGRLQTSKSVI